MYVKLPGETRVDFGVQTIQTGLYMSRIETGSIDILAAACRIIKPCSMTSRAGRMLTAMIGARDLIQTVKA